MAKISVTNISKKFKIGHRKHQTFLRGILSLISGVEPKKEIWPLKNVSFDVKPGEIFGIIGSNGSGKSTLLRVIAGIYTKDSGFVRTNGKIISLINLNIGMHDRLSMRDNIHLCCSLFGLGRKATAERIGSIARFAELEEFMETKLYQFSEGMIQRLAFSIAMHCNPEILLLDEVFEIGDESFREKSAKKIKELVKEGASVVLVTHDLEAVKKYCDRLMWLERGEVKQIGDSKKVLKDYVSFSEDS